MALTQTTQIVLTAMVENERKKRELPPPVRVPSYAEVLDLCLVKGWVEYARDAKTGQRTDDISEVHHAAITQFVHLLKQKPIPAILLMGASKSAPDTSGIVVKKFAPGVSGLPQKQAHLLKRPSGAKANVGETGPKREVRAVDLSEF